MKVNGNNHLPNSWKFSCRWFTKHAVIGHDKCYCCSKSERGFSVCMCFWMCVINFVLFRKCNRISIQSNSTPIKFLQNTFPERASIERRVPQHWTRTCYSLFLTDLIVRIYYSCVDSLLFCYTIPSRYLLMFILLKENPENRLNCHFIKKNFWIFFIAIFITTAIVNRTGCCNNNPAGLYSGDDGFEFRLSSALPGNFRDNTSIYLWPFSSKLSPIGWLWFYSTYNESSR
jgi:hypothetical protein